MKSKKDQETVLGCAASCEPHELKSAIEAIGEEQAVGATLSYTFCASQDRL